EAARAEGGWGASSFHPASTRKLLTPVEDEQDQAQRQQDRACDHAELGIRCRLREHDRARCRLDHRTLQRRKLCAGIAEFRAALGRWRDRLDAFAEYLLEIPAGREIERQLGQLQRCTVRTARRLVDR